MRTCPDANYRTHLTQMKDHMTYKPAIFLQQSITVYIERRSHSQRRHIHGRVNYPHFHPIIRVIHLFDHAP